ncbi:MAG TPA: hypothetical protein VGR57_07300 [Ktedonobacterales bacterium]|nr:hypothetical protein [Ktedonobacterales bacterium]
MLTALGAVLAHLLTGQIERGSHKFTTKPWWRVPVTLVIVASSAWVAYASAFLWATSVRPGIVGLLAFVRSGGPAWVLAAPLLALATLAAAIMPAAGRYGLVMFLAFATFWLVLLALATFAPGATDVSWPELSSYFATNPALLLALITVWGDAAPLESPLIYGNMTYWGRVGVLRALTASAHRLGWAVSIPNGTGQFYTTGGYLGGKRDVQVVAGYSLQYDSMTFTGGGYWIKAQVNALRPIPGAMILRRRIHRDLAARATTGTVAGGPWPLRYYVMTPRPPSADWQTRFTQQIVRGRAYLGGRQPVVRVVRGGLLYARYNPFRMPRRYGEIERLAEWLIGLAALLEELAPDAPVAPPAPLDLLPPTR